MFARFSIARLDTFVPSPLQLHLLRGWRDTTLLSYNAAVRKFKRFLEANEKGHWTLPASPDDIYAFCFWSGRTEQGANDQDVTAITLKNTYTGCKLGTVITTYLTLTLRKEEWRSCYGLADARTR